MDPAIFTQSYIRGVYRDQITEEDAWKIGSATARFLRSMLTGYRRGQANAQSLCVGRDMRTHSEALANALISGMNATGANVIDIGMIDTPQMYFAVNYLGTCGGVQVTASHLPEKYNGFKITGLDAKPVDADTGLRDIKHIAMAMLHTKARPGGSVTKQDLTARYKNHVLKFLHPGKKKLRIAIDASNGMAGKIIPIIFGGLPVEIVPLNFEHDGRFKHAPDPFFDEYLADLKAAVKHDNCRFGACFDGDADRLIIVDENANTVASDLIMALMVPYFLDDQPGSTVVYDLRSSRVVIEEIIKHGGTPRRERIGHTFMKKAMRDSHALFGADLSGLFYYRDNYSTDSALITLVHLINILARSDLPVSRLVEPLRRYHARRDIIFKVGDQKAKTDELAKRYGDAQTDYLDGLTIGYKDWWCNCRPSSSEPVLTLSIEAKTRELLEKKLSEIKDTLGDPVPL
jgi:phosphomannomutase